MLISPHGIYVDKEDNIWVTDYQDNAPLPARGGGAGRSRALERPGRGRRPRGPIGPRPGATKGHQVFKFSPERKAADDARQAGRRGRARLLLCAERRDRGAQWRLSSSPRDTAQGTTAILKFTKDGKLIKTWGKLGTGPGEFDQPHALAFDSKGRLYVGDRNNNRIQIFDQDGNFISRDEAVQPAERNLHRQARHPSTRRIPSPSRCPGTITAGSGASASGSLKDGKVIAFIPDPAEKATGTSAAEGVAVGRARATSTAPKWARRT